MYIALTAVMYYTTITILTKAIAIDIALLVISACDYCRKYVARYSYLDIAFVCDYNVRYWH